MTDDAVSVRVVEWNVSMALHRKAPFLAELAPSIAVLPETAHPDKTRAALEAVGATRSSTSVQWIGSEKNKNKGLSVVAFDGWDLRIDESYDAGYEWVMPVHVIGPSRIRLLAVWDMNVRGKGHDSARALGSCRASLSHYGEFLDGDADLTVISGDFNNSVRWDTPEKEAKFGDFMDDLESRGFASAYHLKSGCGRGEEPEHTLWWRKNVDASYHIDYTFVRPGDAIQDVTIGKHEDWLAYSDHPPMTVDLRL